MPPPCDGGETIERGMMMIIRCLSVDVFRSAADLGDCTNGGISSRFRSLLVACPDGPEEIDASVSIPLNFCRIRKRYICGRDVYDIRPAAVDEYGDIVDRGGHWYMMGGNFAYTCDSRLAAMAGGLHTAIPVHDRREH